MSDSTSEDHRVYIIRATITIERDGLPPRFARTPFLEFDKAANRAAKAHRFPGKPARNFKRLEREALHKLDICIGLVRCWPVVRDLPAPILDWGILPESDVAGVFEMYIYVGPIREDVVSLAQWIRSQARLMLVDSECYELAGDVHGLRPPLYHPETFRYTGYCLNEGDQWLHDADAQEPDEERMDDEA